MKNFKNKIANAIAQAINLNENQSKLNSLLKARESLTFWNNLDYAMQTNKDIK